MKKYQPEFAVQETWKRESRKLNETCSLLHVQCKNGQQIQICTVTKISLHNIEFK